MPGLCRQAVVEAVGPVAVVAIVLLAWRCEPARGFNNPDDVRYALVSRVWEQGALPYRDAVDHKPPVIYLFHRACFAFGGATPYALWQGFTLLAMVPSLFVYAALRLARRPGAAVFSALTMAYMGVCTPLGIETVNTERLVFYLAVVAFSLATLVPLGGGPVLAGLAGAASALAFWTKQPGVWLAVPGVAATAAFGRQTRAGHPLAATAWFGAGFGVVGIGWIAYFAARGGFFQLVDWVFLRNLGYAGWNRVDLAARYDVVTAAFRSLRPLLLSPAGMPVTALLVGLAVVLVLRASALATAALLWLGAGLAAACTGVSMDDHYLLFLFPGVVVSAAAVGAWVVDGDGAAGERPPGDAIAKGVVLGALVFGGPLTSRLATPRPAPQAVEEIAAGGDIAGVVKSLAVLRRDGDRIQVLGGREDLVFASGLVPATRWLYLPTDTLWKRGEDLGLELLRETATAAPALVLMGQDLHDEIHGPDTQGFALGVKQLLGSTYSEVVNEDGVYVYRRRDATQRPPGVTAGT